MHTRSSLIVVALFALIALSHAAFDGEAISVYTRFYQKESGASKTTNSDLINEWDSCTPQDSTCVTKLPPTLGANDVKAECHTNSGAKNVYDFSTSDFFTLLSTGGAPATGMQNWVDEVCGKTIQDNDFVTVFIYDVTKESSDWATETAAVFQSYIRLWYLYDGAEPVSSFVSIDSSKPSVTMVYRVRVPPQGSGVSFHPQFFPTYGTETNGGDWTNLDQVEYCETPSSFSSTDTQVNSLLQYTLELEYETYVSLVNETQSGDLEISQFYLDLFAYECTPTESRGTAQKLYLTTGNVTYNRQVVADSEVSSAMQTMTQNEIFGYLRLSSSLRFCSTPDCANPITGSPSFVINQDIWALLEIPASERNFATQSMSLVDGDGNKISGGITLAIEDEDQVGKVIYRVSFARVYSRATLSVKAAAEPAARRLLADESEANSSTKGHMAVNSATLQVCDGDNCDVEDEEDDKTYKVTTSASNITAFAAFFASIFYLF